MQKQNLLIYIILAGIFFSCTKKEAPLTPSEGMQGYVVPQGNHDYDTTIVNFYKKFGTYLLYEFTDKDTYWSPGALATTYRVTKADQKYVKKQLTLLDSTWFRYYTDKFLDEFLPAKIMLCSNVDSIYKKFLFNPTRDSTIYQPVAAYYNYDNICVSNASSAIDTMKVPDKKKYFAKINTVFIQSITGRKMVTPTDMFATIANYTTTYTSYAAAYGQGILYTYYNGPNATLDWGLYMLAMIGNSEATLNTSTPNTDATFKGILNATKDVNGKIRARYNIVRNYYITNYNVDLQAIGNIAGS